MISLDEAKNSLYVSLAAKAEHIEHIENLDKKIIELRAYISALMAIEKKADKAD